MASPTIESLCCISSTSEFTQTYLVGFQTTAYNVVSTIASLLGILGALYQVTTKSEKSSNIMQRQRSLKIRSQFIIKWLAIADLLAAFGILIRSVSWLIDGNLQVPNRDDTLSQFFCITSAGWIHYFYTATYMWTFIYALDVKHVLQGKRIDQRLYHLFAWTIPAVFCIGGLLFLYLPDLNCHSRLVDPYQRFLPNYLSTFLPILFVMVFNPILYITSFSSIEKFIITNRGRFTNTERQLIKTLKLKFLLINIVFFVCWLPNIVNGLLLWTSWDSLPRDVLITLWFIMAIFNPLQAVFNCLVYRSWSADTISQSSRIQKPLFGGATKHEGKEIQPKETEGCRPTNFWRLFGRRKSSEETPLLLVPATTNTYHK